MNYAKAFDVCVRKSRAMIGRLADDPRTCSNAPSGDYFTWTEGFYEIGNWTSSFFTGMALLAYRKTKDAYFLQQVERLAPWYETKATERSADTMHDLGFLYTLYSVALYKLTRNPAHREVGMQAARVLADRFVPAGGYIRAWGRMDEHGTDYEGLAIIDCMMNLPLLHWAAKESGEMRLRDIATRHADTTLKLFLRDDDSVFHAYRFDPKTGKPTGGENYCGRAIPSHWARGTAWAIYGFALSYSYTRDPRYLAASLRVAMPFIRGLGEAAVPVWDFKLPPGETPLLDSSASAVATCGMQELLKHKPGDPVLTKAKDQMLAGLCSPEFLDERPECLGVLRFGEVGDGLGKAKNAYTSWGDYYLMEALDRELGHGPTFW